MACWIAASGIQRTKSKDGFLEFSWIICSNDFLFHGRLWPFRNGWIPSRVLVWFNGAVLLYNHPAFQISKILMQLRLLRLFLGFSAFAWGISAVGVFVSWPEAEQLLERLGAKPIPYDPMLDYWLRMAAGAFALVGVWYLALTIWPRKFYAAIPWFGVLMLVEGLILFVHGLRLSLPPFPFYGDVSACFIAGSGIVIFSRFAKAVK